MMEEIILPAEKRGQLTKGQLKSKRRKGKIPAIVYGGGQSPVPLFVEQKQFQKILDTSLGENVIIHLEIDKASSKMVMIKELQRNLLNDNLLHIDFQQISLTKKIEVTVPLQIVGEAVGVKSGGILEQLIWELKIRCLPTKIPEVLTVDVSNLEIGKNILVKDIVPKGIDILQNLEQVVVTVSPPPVVTEEVVAPPVPEVTEPEVIGKKRKEEVEMEEKEVKEEKK